MATAAKLCYSPETHIDRIYHKLTAAEINRFIKKLLDMGHESPLEHISFTFGVQGISRITEVQLVRHRLASYSVQSGRYVRRENPDFIVPPSVESYASIKRRYIAAMMHSANAYNEMFLMLMLKQIGKSDDCLEYMRLEDMIDQVQDFQNTNPKEYKKFEKLAMKDSRYAHLQALATNLVVTMNARQLLHFFSKRCCDRAQWEIRTLANKMLEICQESAPSIFENVGPSCVKGKCPEGALSCGNPKRV